MVVFIIGPSGSGKSTTAALLSSTWHTTCALLKFDKIRTFIKSGYAEPAHGWNEKTKAQWDIAKEVVAGMSRAYNNNKIDVILEVFATPNDLDSYKELFEGLDYRFIVLLPTLETVLTRNNQREGVEKLKDEVIRQNYKWSEAWRDVKGAVVIDNANITTDEVVRKIITSLN